MKLIVQPDAGIPPVVTAIKQARKTIDVLIFRSDRMETVAPSYKASNDRFVVSPENARERLAAFLKGARHELLIYDPNVCDDAMLRIITERIRAGIKVKIIGSVEAKWNVKSQPYPGKRLHVRAIVRDGTRAFVGSQSLRRLELEKRREVGIIITN